MSFFGIGRNSSHKLRRRLVDTVVDQIQFRSEYFLLLVFSTVVSTLGLLANNAPVVIGSMLISPLIWSVFGISLGLITMRGHIFFQAAKSFVVSVLLVLLVSALVSSLAPELEMNEQIQARLNPGLTDLLIALAAAAAGVISTYYPKASSPLYMTGVSIALSLLPSLAVVGIGLSQFSWKIIAASSLLFATNIMAIILASCLVLYFLKFSFFEA